MLRSEAEEGSGKDEIKNSKEAEPVEVKAGGLGFPRKEAEIRFQSIP